jgi:phosphoribosylformylglycinamidine synthase
MQKVKVFVLRAPGTNCDYETAFAFQKTDAKTDVYHINHWIDNKSLIHQYHILVIPGGFTYGDNLGAGTVLGNEITQGLLDELTKFITDGKLILGICNGFQVLVKIGLLPGLTKDNGNPKKEAILFTNNSARYEDRWVYLKKYSQICVFTKNIPKEVIYLPVAHGEGKFITNTKETLSKIIANDQVVFRYSDVQGNPTSRYPLNPNGAQDNIAAICDRTGRIMGMMPHPERFQDITNHPRWTREKIDTPDGMFIFQNALHYVKQHL